MAIDVCMPRLSDTMEEGKVLTWLKQVGDQVEIGDIIAEVETDKADMEMEALDEGVLIEIVVPEGGSVAVGGVLARLGTAEEASAGPTSAPHPTPQPPASHEAPATTNGSAHPEPQEHLEPPPKVRELREVRVQNDRPQAGDESRIIASPLVRRMAEEQGIDLSQVSGSGPGGRIIRRDLETRDLKASAAPTTDQVADASPASAAPVAAPQPSNLDENLGGNLGGNLEPFSRMRATIAKRMSESMREAPHFYLTAEINMSEAVRLRTSLKASDRVSADVTYTHLIIKAAALALSRHPRINASFAGDARQYKDEMNIGLAVSLEDGLIVPVLHHCEQLSLLDIAEQANALVERARTGKPKPEDLSGGTFTISNLGMLPIDHFTAIINQPQAAILAVGAIKERPVVRDGQVTIASTMMATLSCDHRIVDGMVGGQFLAELKSLLENPVGLMV